MSEERTFQEKLDSLPEPITSKDLEGLNPKTNLEHCQVMHLVGISMLKRLERINVLVKG